MGRRLFATPLYRKLLFQVETKMNESNSNFHKIKAVIFDLDGTLLDSFSVHYEVYEIMFAFFGIRIEKEKFLNSYSPNWYETYKAMGLPKDKWDSADDLWVKEANKREPNIYSGTVETLNKLYENFTLGLVTSGSKSRVERDLNNNDIKGFFNVIVTGDDIKNPKPHPEGLEIALNELGLHPEDVIYIGDAYDDYKMADIAGIKFIGIMSDFANLKKNDHEYKVCYISDIPAILGL